MIIPVIIVLMMSAPSELISAAIGNYEHTGSYRVTLRSGAGGDEQVIRYYYKKPGFVKMEFVKPHEGAVLLYSPVEEKVKTVPFRFLPFFSLTLDPDNILIRSQRGHTIDKSDLGSLLVSAAELGGHGGSVISGEEDINGRKALRLKVESDGTYNIGGIHAYELWLDKESLMPLKALSFDIEGRLIEEVIMDDLEINVEFPDGFFGEDL